MTRGLHVGLCDESGAVGETVNVDDIVFILFSLYVQILLFQFVRRNNISHLRLDDYVMLVAARGSILVFYIPLPSQL